jgi:hypothetical protein
MGNVIYSVLDGALDAAFGRLLLSPAEMSACRMLRLAALEPTGSEAFRFAGEALTDRIGAAAFPR